MHKELMNCSPAQRIFIRRTRTLVPAASRLLVPRIETNVDNNLYKRKAKQSRYYNKGTRELPELKAGDIVRIQPLPNNKGKWVLVKVEVKMNIRKDTG